MQDEELDKIINDAASQHHPAYDDEAWGKMHALLDKHLPQKKDKRRPLFFWLLFLLVGGAAIVTGVMQPWKNNTAADLPIAATETKAATGNNIIEENTTTPFVTPYNKEENKNAAIQKTATVAIEEPVTAATTVTTGSSANSYNIPAATTTKIIQGNKKNLKNNNHTAVKINAAPIAADNAGSGGNASIKKNAGSKTKAKVKAAKPVEDENEMAADEPVNSVANNATVAETVSTNVVTDKITVAAPKDTTAEKLQLVTATPQKKQNSNKGFKNNFAILISGGIDKSYVATTKPGKTKFIHGVSAAYNIAKRFTVSTGFFVSNKVYDALPSQYKFPAGTTYPNLWLINANCKVYEIPVNISYNFLQGKKHSWFAGGGLLTVIMKEEYYNYKYKTPSGQYYNYERTYSNENKHFFSVVTISGGYKYSLTSRIQVMAAPYIKLPLSGIGAGAIQLKSGGILFTAAIKPFVKK
jgi:hypothetical protein